MCAVAKVVDIRYVFRSIVIYSLVICKAGRGKILCKDHPLCHVLGMMNNNATYVVNVPTAML